MKNSYLFCLLFLFLSGCSKEMANPSTTTGTGGSLARFAIVNNYMYIVDAQNLKVLDISNGAAPQLKQDIHVGFEIETIYPFKENLFIGSTSVIHIFSLQDPARPKKLSEAISPTVMRRCDPVVAKDSVAYATLRTSGPCGGMGSILAVYDIRDIKNPIPKASVDLGEPYGLGYRDSALYVCDKLSGLLVFNIADPYQPEFVQAINDGRYIDVIPHGNTLICWEEKGVNLFDISEPLQPKPLVKIQ